MYEKKGKLVENAQTQQDSSLMILSNPKGQKFEVSYTTAFIWNLFDGKHSRIDIKKKLGDLTDLSDEGLEEIIEDVISGLKKFDLLKAPLEINR